MLLQRGKALEASVSLGRKSVPCGRGQGLSRKTGKGGGLCSSGRGQRGQVGEGCPGSEGLLEALGARGRVGVSASGGGACRRPGSASLSGAGVPTSSPRRPAPRPAARPPGTHSRSGRCRCRMAQKARPSRKELLRSRMSTPR